MCIGEFYRSSIGKKQIVAVTGLLLILYVVVHLAGNLLIYMGPDVFNGYAKKLAGLRPGLYIIEFLLFVIFIAHFYVTGVVVMENRKARGWPPYANYRDVGKRSVATQIMPYTGTILLIFIIFHIYDFTLIDHNGHRSVLPFSTVSSGLYGVVFNSFMDPLHSAFYIIAMCSLGLHLSHGIKSFFQTLGLAGEEKQKSIAKISNIIAILIVVGYSSIPVYVLMQSRNYVQTAETHAKF